jgi:DnaJ-class molecular chaperone
LELRLPVTLGEAALGATIDVPTPGGVVSLKVPPNSSSGRRLRIKGQGVRQPSGEAGDLYVELQIKLPASLDQAAQDAIATIEQQYTGSVREKLAW